MDHNHQHALRAILADWRDGTLTIDEAAYQMAVRAAYALGEPLPRVDEDDARRVRAARRWTGLGRF